MHSTKLKFILLSQIGTATGIASPIHLSFLTWLSQYYDISLSTLTYPQQLNVFGENINENYPTTQSIPNLPLSSRYHSSHSQRSPTTPQDCHPHLITMTMVAHARNVIQAKHSSPTSSYDRTSSQIGLKTKTMARTPSG